MKLHALMSATEMEKRLLERNRCRLNIAPALLYFGGALLVGALMGWGFGWPQINDGGGAYTEDYGKDHYGY